MCGKTHRLGNECLCGKNRHRFLETEGIAYPAGLGGGHMEKLQNWSVGRRYGRNHGQEPLLWFPWAGTIEAVQAGLWHPTLVFLPGKSHGQRSLVGCSPRGCWGSDTTEQLHFHFSLACIGEGNGNPLQCSCLENPRDGGTWWAAVYGVAQSQTRLKQLSSSSSSRVRIG